MDYGKDFANRIPLSESSCIPELRFGRVAERQKVTSGGQFNRTGILAVPKPGLV